MKCLRDFAIFAFDSAANRVMIFEQALVCDLTMFPGRIDGWMDEFEEKDSRPIGGPRSTRSGSASGSTVLQPATSSIMIINQLIEFGVVEPT